QYSYESRTPPSPSLPDALPISGHGPFDGVRAEEGDRRISAHAAGVGSFVAVEGTFVVTRRRERQDAFAIDQGQQGDLPPVDLFLDRKSTRLNSSHRTISHAVFC